jgi:hypothetical protein
MAEGRSPRSVARAVACYRGFYRFSRGGRPAAGESRRRRPRAPRVEGAAALLSQSRTSTACSPSPMSAHQRAFATAP